MFSIVAIITITLAGGQPKTVENPNPYKHFQTMQECTDYAQFALPVFKPRIEAHMPADTEVDVKMECREGPVVDDGSI